MKSISSFPRLECSFACFDKVSNNYRRAFEPFFADVDEHFGIERRLIGANLRHVIVDEADTLLDITFSPAVVEIIRRLEVTERQPLIGSSCTLGA